jgi:hypothetical protein
MYNAPPPPTFLSDFNQILILSTDFHKLPNSLKSVQWELG